MQSTEDKGHHFHVATIIFKMGVSHLRERVNEIISFHISSNFFRWLSSSSHDPLKLYPITMCFLRYLTLKFFGFNKF